MIQYKEVLVRDGGRKMQVEYTLTEQDFIAFNLHYARHSKMVKRSLVLQHYIVAIILFAVSLSVFYLDHQIINRWIYLLFFTSRGYMDRVLS